MDKPLNLPQMRSFRVIFPDCPVKVFANNIQCCRCAPRTGQPKFDVLNLSGSRRSGLAYE